MLIKECVRSHIILEATTVRQAVQKLEAERVDIIISDLTLPDATGTIAIRRMRAASPDTPLVVLTSFADDKLATGVLEAGAQECLVKDEVLTGQKAGRKLVERTLRCAVQRQSWRRETDQLVRQLSEGARLLESKNRRLADLCTLAQQFTENVSHDFRTPLTVMKEYVSLIADGIAGPINEQQKKMLRVVDDRADDLNNMVDDLLDVNKLEAGLLNVWRRPTSLSHLTDRLAPVLTRKAAVRNVSFVSEIPDDLPELFCDQDKVNRVITNLAVNAIKFCRQAGKVELSARPDFTRNELIVSVSDEGPGIPAEQLGLLFRRFAQLESGAHHPEKGFGLGLSIAKELVDLNLGEISVESQVEVGSTFRFTIPFNDQRELFRRYFDRLHRSDTSTGNCVLLRASADCDADDRALKDFDIFLGSNVRRNDFVLQNAPLSWLMLMDISSLELDRFLERISASLCQLSRNRPFGPLPELHFELLGNIELSESVSRNVETVLQQTMREECYA